MSAEEGPNPRTEPESRVLLASQSRAWLLFAGCSVFTAGSIWMIVSGDRTGWLGLALFGTLAVLIAWGIRLPPRLELGDRTMTYTVRGKSRMYDLGRCGEFHVRDIPAGPLPFRYTRHQVTFDYEDPSDGTVRRAFERLDEATGSENHLFAPWIFGMRADDLAGLLNEYRARALANGGKPPAQA